MHHRHDARDGLRPFGDETELIAWRIHHKAETASTNLDARAGAHGDVFTADFQTAGRGRLDHKWLSPPGTNLMMSVVLSVEGLQPEQVATLPLVVGLAVAQGLSPFISTLSRGLSPRLKWPNDVLVADRKIAGILCERQGDFVIAGVGVNVGQKEFPPEIAEKSISLANIAAGNGACPQRVRDEILVQIDGLYERWRTQGFSAVYLGIVALDYLKGRRLSVRQTDDDPVPVSGLCGGIAEDGSLTVDGKGIYAGEAHVLRMEDQSSSGERK